VASETTVAESDEPRTWKRRGGKRKPYTIETFSSGPCTGNGKGGEGARHPAGVWIVASRYATEKARDEAFGKLVFDRAGWPTRKGDAP
jgi:hypothetical protein